MFAVMIGCDGGGRNAEPVRAPEESGAPPAAPEAPPTVLMLGTSLTAGLGLQPADAYPALVQQRIDSAGLPFRVVNAGVSGETSAGALRRLDGLMRLVFEVLLLERGANDMLRGINPDSTRANIQAIIDRVRSERPGAPIVLAGMLAPPNLGREYAAEFGEMFQELAAENHIRLIPFLLEGVGGIAGMNQADGIHPNEEGAAVVAANVWEILEPVLHEAAAHPPGQTGVAAPQAP